MIKMQIKTSEGVFVPLYDSDLVSGFDLMAKNFKKLFKGNKEVLLDSKLKKSIEEGYLTLRGFERVLVGTGLFIDIPQGYEIQVRDKTGNALKKGLLVANAPGTISADYKGELTVVLINNTPFLCKITLGDRIAQGVVMKVIHTMWEQVKELPPSDLKE